MQDKELDLGDVIKISSNFLKSNIWYFVFFIVCGVVLGGVKYSFENDAYKTDIYAKSEFLPLELISGEISSINDLIKSNDYDNLSSIFNNPSLDSIEIESISFKTVYDEDKFFMIQVKSTGKENLNDEIVSSFKEILTENLFIAEFLQNKKDKTETLLENHIQQKENLNKIYQQIENDLKVNKPNSIIIEPGSIAIDILEIESEIFELSAKLKREGAFNIVDIIHSIQKPSLLKEMASSIIIVLFAGTVLLLAYKFIRLS
ncbi:MAG: hypothetical protein WD048_04425 [Chitinophagales bacterium]